MYKNYDEFIENIRNKKIMFCGIGRSNLPFIDSLTQKNIPVTVYDSKQECNLNEKLVKQLKENKFIDLRLHDESVWQEKNDVIIRTPGMNFFCDKLLKAAE